LYKYKKISSYIILPRLCFASIKQIVHHYKIFIDWLGRLYYRNLLHPDWANASIQIWPNAWRAKCLPYINHCDCDSYYFIWNVDSTWSL